LAVGRKTDDRSLQNYYCYEINEVKMMASFRQVWQDFLRKVMAQKGLFGNDDDILI
jgi:hypothetical protein